MRLPMLIRLTRLLNSPDVSKTSKNLVTSSQVRSFMSTLPRQEELPFFQSASL